MGCCTSQINHDLEMAIQKVKEIESQSRQHLAIKQYGVEIILVNLNTMTAKRNGIG